LCQQPRVRVNGESAGGLAWVITGGLLFHHGATGGFPASMAIDQAAGHGMAALVNTSGSTTPLLRAAVMTAVKGNDPRQVRPRDTGETARAEWDERAGALARALLDGDYASAHQMLPAESQPKVAALGDPPLRRLVGFPSAIPGKPRNPRRSPGPRPSQVFPRGQAADAVDYAGYSFLLPQKPEDILETLPDHDALLPRRRLEGGCRMSRAAASLAIVRATSRVVLAAPFIASGVEYFRDRRAREEVVRNLGYPVPEADAFIDAAAKTGCGLALAAGFQPELSAAALIADLAPMTVSTHAFWKAEDPRSRAMERNAFILNVAVAGGLLAVITGSRRGKRASSTAPTGVMRCRRLGTYATCKEAASHADPRTTMRYDRARTSLDRHATYIVATYIAGAAR
jgi:uncharacterized membrane protein YphA (DoxX/SURF4 family)